MTYDETEYKVIVEVTETNQVLEAKVTYPTGQPTFKNTYIEQPTGPTEPTEVTAQFYAQKVLTGRPLQNNEFVFDVFNEQGKLEVSATNTADGKIEFPKLTFTEAGTYTYIIKERIPQSANQESNMTYDETEYKVIVNVTEAANKLEATVTYPLGHVTFKNTYTEQPTETTEVTAAFNAQKVLTGRPLQNNEFIFDVFNAQGQLEVSATNIADGKIEFPELRFTEAGTYTYIIKERIPQGDNQELNMTYDQTEHKVIVNVTATEDELVATVTYPMGQPTFKNTYIEQPTGPTEPTDVTAKFYAQKELTGRPLKANEFTFDVFNAQGELEVSASNTADGKIEFPELKFNEVGTYTYIIKERIPQGANQESNMTYDQTEFKVIVNVTKGADGLEATVTYPLGHVTFKNTYTEQPTETTEVTAKFNAQKELIGRPLKANEFIFDVFNEQGELEVSATNKVDGKIEFPSLTFNKVGTYTYIIKERIPADSQKESNMTYDETEYKVVVNVTESEKGLAATVTYPQGNVTFKNTYTEQPTEVTATFNAQKVLVGRPLKDKEFIFDVFNEQGELVLSASNNVNGKIEFEELTFTKVGTYTYMIKERIPTKDNQESNMIYDETEYKVIVTMTKAEDGLVATVTYPQGDVTFKNEYIEKPTAPSEKSEVTAVFNAYKELIGRPLKGNEFIFDVFNEQGELLVSASNTKDGRILFPALTFTEAGTYTYIIKERIPQGDSNMTYDETEYKVVVNVVETEEGLVATVTYPMGEVIFKNVYTGSQTLPETGLTNFTVVLGSILLGLGVVIASKKEN